MYFPRFYCSVFYRKKWQKFAVTILQVCIELGELVINVFPYPVKIVKNSQKKFFQKFTFNANLTIYQKLEIPDNFYQQNFLTFIS